ncbi:MAG TPA: hypothetical protein VI319_02935 [Burkholderiales bacterium]
MRLFAIWLVLYVIRSGPGLWVMNARESDATGMALVLVVVAVMLLVAALLWLFPLSVASALMPRSALEQRGALPIEDLQRCGFLLLGLWVLATSIPGVLRYAFIYFLTSQRGNAAAFAPEVPAAFAGLIAETLIGIWLVFGAKGLVGLVRWARDAGH